MNRFEPGREYAQGLDSADVLNSFRGRFHFPKDDSGKDLTYLCGHSLGLQPVGTAKAVGAELARWSGQAVGGHFTGPDSWMNLHAGINQAMARLVGASTEEVVVMNTLSVNLHAMLATFYRPSTARDRVLIESDAFPSDRHAVASQIALNGGDPEKSLIELAPDNGPLVSLSNLEAVLSERGEEISLILLGGVNYYTGQRLDLGAVTRLCHRYGCRVGFDLAHAVGNVPLALHDAGPDFAVWCTYKYLNAGPGALGACFVHNRHSHSFDLPRMAGWWGHNTASRFEMRGPFDPEPGAAGWQVSNPPILSLAPIRSALELFEEAGMHALRAKSVQLTAYLEWLLPDNIQVLTPTDPDQRGCQLSLSLGDEAEDIFEKISKAGIVADFRKPDVIRLAPAPLYNSFEDVWVAVDELRRAMA